MGKKKKGAVCNNPIAMARAAGAAPVTGPTLRDYFKRDRPSLEEAADIIASQHKKKESGALAAYEEQLNDNYRQELKERREQLLGTGSHSKVSSHKSDDRDKRKKKKKSKKKKKTLHRDRSRSRSPHSTPFYDSDSESDSPRPHRHKSAHKKKSRHKSGHHQPRTHSSSDTESSS